MVQPVNHYLRARWKLRFTVGVKARTTRRLLIGAATFAVLYVAVCIFARSVYPKFLFPAPQEEDAFWKQRVRGGEEVMSGPTSLYWIPPRGNERVVVMFHGNGETKLAQAGIAGMIGGGALLVEYRGYGATPGPPPSEQSLYEDGENAIAFLRSKGIGPERTTLFGYSLGSGVAAELATRGHASRLVLVAPFTSIPDVAQYWVRVLPMSLLMSHRLDTLSKAERIHVPTLVVHGDRDRIVPFAEGKAVAAKIPGARFVHVAGGGHTDLFGDPDTVHTIRDFAQ